MSFGTHIYFRRLVILAALLIAATSMSAQGQTSNQKANATLMLTATVQKALYLEMSVGGLSAGHAAGLTPAAVATLTFDNLNGFRVGTPGTGMSSELVSVTRQSNGTLYTTPITLTPHFSGFSSTAATITVLQDPNADAASQAAVREGSSVASVSTVSTTTPNIVTSSVMSGASITRYVGMFISEADDRAHTARRLTSKLTYELTVP